MVQRHPADHRRDMAMTLLIADTGNQFRRAFPT
jgi:hypothetical protein